MQNKWQTPFLNILLLYIASTFKLEGVRRLYIHFLNNIFMLNLYSVLRKHNAKESIYDVDATTTHLDLYEFLI